MAGGMDLEPDGRVGGYRLIRPVGEGGFGVVYLAEQLEPVKRQVALKIIKLGMDTRQVVARFEAERQALALMDHPGIARVFDAGATETGRPYFVMEFVEGVPITDYADRQRLAIAERLELFIKVCDALQHAHQKGVIHRDLKPSNILVAVQGTPKIIDFGLVKATHAELTDKTLITQFQQLIGTPAYMSPEQVEGGAVDVDTRADIYSLGVLLYELLTGRTPFDTQELMRGGMGEAVRRIREQDPPKPSACLRSANPVELADVARRRQVSPEKMPRQVDGDLDCIVMKALEKNRVRRYETANALALDIRRHLSSEPVQARPPSRVYQFRKLVRRNRLGFAAVAIITLVLVVAVIVSSQLAIRAQRAEQEQTKLRRAAEGQERIARQRAYASDINLAQQALAEHNLGRARELLSRQRPGSIKEPDLRGWEWRYLWQQCRSDALFTLARDQGSVYALAASPDSRWLAWVAKAAGGSLCGISPRGGRSNAWSME